MTAVLTPISPLDGKLLERSTWIWTRTWPSVPGSGFALATHHTVHAPSRLSPQPINTC